MYRAYYSFVIFLLIFSLGITVVNAQTTTELQNLIVGKWVLNIDSTLKYQKEIGIPERNIGNLDSIVGDTISYDSSGGLTRSKTVETYQDYKPHWFTEKVTPPNSTLMGKKRFRHKWFEKIYSQGFLFKLVHKYHPDKYWGNINAVILFIDPEKMVLWQSFQLALVYTKVD